MDEMKENGAALAVAPAAEDLAVVVEAEPLALPAGE